MFSSNSRQNLKLVNETVYYAPTIYFGWTSASHCISLGTDTSAVKKVQACPFLLYLRYNISY